MNSLTLRQATFVCCHVLLLHRVHANNDPPNNDPPLASEGSPPEFGGHHDVNSSRRRSKALESCPCDPKNKQRVRNCASHRKPSKSLTCVQKQMLLKTQRRGNASASSHCLSHL